MANLDFFDSLFYKSNRKLTDGIIDYLVNVTVLTTDLDHKI